MGLARRKGSIALDVSGRVTDEAFLVFTGSWLCPFRVFFRFHGCSPICGGWQSFFEVVRWLCFSRGGSHRFVRQGDQVRCFFLSETSGCDIFESGSGSCTTLGDGCLVAALVVVESGVEQRREVRRWRS